jgi:hypothetical protein
VREHKRPILLVHVLGKPQALCRVGQHGRQRGLTHGEWIAPQVLAVELDQVECIEKHTGVMTPVSDAIE